MARPPILFPLFAEITSLPGIGPRLGSSFARLGLSKVLHLLWHLPQSVVDRRKTTSLALAKSGEIVTIKAQVKKVVLARRSHLPSKIIVETDEGECEIVYFNAKGDYLEKAYPIGTIRALSGRLENYHGRLTIAHPDYNLPENDYQGLLRLDPVYPLTAGLSQRMMQKAIHLALQKVPEIPEWLDSDFKARMNWPNWGDALRLVHYPKEENDILPDSPGRQRLAYDEMLASQLALSLIREKYRRRAGRSLVGTGELEQRVRLALPFRLTGAQERSLSEIKDDLASPDRMLRLLQGDVGSGKTIVAFLALLVAVEAGGQGALLAPTDILARQHFATLEPLAEMAGVSLTLLTGRDKQGRQREAILKQLSNGTISIIVGTHALIQDDVTFHDLRLAIIDEQHRFGVQQRLALADKGHAIDFLVMTATPIPRTLLMAAYGDIDVSLLDEKPPGRKPIDTRTIQIERLDDVISGLIRATKKGARVYWVCPLVEESEILDLAAATDRAAYLSQFFKVGLVHGRQKPAERNKVIGDFADGDLEILVATTVIEVGVNIPRATVMVVEHAERFGLAQLHQLRGRVGRGLDQSTCLLLYHSALTATGKARLAIMRETEDGFRIAEEDLRLRGGGEVLGSRQSGIPEFRLADLNVHHALLKVAADDARLTVHRKYTGLRAEALRNLLYLFERDAAIATTRSG